MVDASRTQGLGTPRQDRDSLRRRDKSLIEFSIRLQNSKDMSTKRSISRSRHPLCSHGVIDHGCEFEGKLCFQGTVRIGGVFQGEIFTPDTLIVGEGARVHGQIEAGTVMISGEVSGTFEPSTEWKSTAPPFSAATSSRRA